MGKLSLVLFSAIGWFYYLLPRRLRLTTGNSLGWILQSIRMRERVVRQNLQYAFPESPHQREKVFREGYRHFGNLVFEILMLFGPMRRFALQEATIEGVENYHEALAQGRGVILVASHIGNWEIMSAAGGVQLGMDLMLVTKHLKPEWLHQAIEKNRLRCGVRATYEPRTLRDVLAHLKRGAVVGFVLDQYAGPPVSFRVPLFGIPVGTTSAVAMLAKRTGAPVLPVLNYREPNGRYRIQIRPPLAWQTAEAPNEELGANTARFAEQIEKDIYSHPDQWLWIHRRFKGDLSPLRTGEWAEGRARR